MPPEDSKLSPTEWEAGIRRIQRDRSIWGSPPEPKGMEVNFRSLKQTAEEIGEEAFQEMAPHLFSLYKEMKTIEDFRKMSKILNEG